MRCSYNCTATPWRDEYRSPTQTKCQQQTFAVSILMLENGEWRMANGRKRKCQRIRRCRRRLAMTIFTDGSPHDRIHLLMDSDVYFAAKQINRK